jgi:hypothetical protein
MATDRIHGEDAVTLAFEENFEHLLRASSHHVSSPNQATSLTPRVATSLKLARP